MYDPWLQIIVGLHLDFIEEKLYEPVSEFDSLFYMCYLRVNIALEAYNKIKLNNISTFFFPVHFIFYHPFPSNRIYMYKGNVRTIL